MGDILWDFHLLHFGSGAQKDSNCQKNGNLVFKITITLFSSFNILHFRYPANVILLLHPSIWFSAIPDLQLLGCQCILVVSVISSMHDTHA